MQTSVKWDLLEQGDNSTQTSIGLYAASATYTNATDWDDFQNRESTFWVNQEADPRKVDASDDESWIGLSKYVLEKSAITGDSFTTNFNLGNGYNYFKDGQKYPKETGTIVVWRVFYRLIVGLLTMKAIIR